MKVLNTMTYLGIRYNDYQFKRDKKCAGMHKTARALSLKQRA